VFDHDDGVGAGGGGGAGHDFYGLAGLKGERGVFAGADFTGQVEVAWQVGGPDGETIAHGAVKGGIGAVGEDVGGEDAAGGFG
jgi:hypothetical protein